MCHKPLWKNFFFLVISTLKNLINHSEVINLIDHSLFTCFELCPTLSSQVAEENTLFTWEMSLKLKVVTVELSLDSERHDAPTQVVKKTLVAQAQEMNIK